MDANQKTFLFWPKPIDVLVTDLDLDGLFTLLHSQNPLESIFTALFYPKLALRYLPDTPFPFRLPFVGPRYLIWTSSSRDESIVDRLPHLSRTLIQRYSISL